MSLENICKICHCTSEESGLLLISPCLCTGSIEFVDQVCLQRWIESSGNKSCELCKQIITVEYQLKPFTQWTKLNISCIDCKDLIKHSETFLLCVFTAILQYGYFMWWRPRTTMESGIDLIMSLVSLTVLVLGLRTMYLIWTEITRLIKKWRVKNSVIVVRGVKQP